MLHSNSPLDQAFLTLYSLVVGLLESQEIVSIVWSLSFIVVVLVVSELVVLVGFKYYSISTIKLVIFCKYRQFI